MQYMNVINTIDIYAKCLSEIVFFEGWQNVNFNSSRCYRAFSSPAWAGDWVCNLHDFRIIFVPFEWKTCLVCVLVGSTPSDFESHLKVNLYHLIWTEIVVKTIRQKKGQTIRVFNLSCRFLILSISGKTNNY